MLMSSSKFFFFKQSSFKLRYETVTRIVQCYSHQACCLLYYLGEINNGIDIYQFTFDFYTSVFGCGCGFGSEQKFGRIAGIDGFGEEKARICGFACPYSPPSLWEHKPHTSVSTAFSSSPKLSRVLPLNN